jgi:hypothetical protein
LLLILIALLISEPIITWGRGWSLLTAAFWNLFIVTFILSATASRPRRTIGLTLAVIDFAIHPLAAYDVAPWLIHLHVLIVFLVMCYIAIWLLSSTLEVSRVTVATLQQGVVVYILFGMIWLQLYLLVDCLQPGSFRLGTGLSDPAAGYIARRTQTAELMYFSFVTLSTVGYGDIVPSRGLARGCAALEGIAGQIYLAVLIARLVGMHIAQSIREEP